MKERVLTWEYPRLMPERWLHCGGHAALWQKYLLPGTKTGVGRLIAISLLAFSIIALLLTAKKDFK